MSTQSRSSSSLPAAHRRSVRVGLIGFGSIAVGSHLPAIAGIEALELAAILDPDPAPPAITRAGLSLPESLLHQSADRFYASGLDAVVVTSPAPAHLENVLEAVDHGLPVLCEKPLAMTAEDGQTMVDAADSAGVPLHVGFCYRFSPVAAVIRDELIAGTIGQPRTLRLIYNWACHGAAIDTETENPVRWHSDTRRRGRMLEGGPMVDCGTHQIDLARWWLGSEVMGVCGQGSWADDYEAPDHVWAHLNHVNGAHTAVEMSFSYGHRCRDLPKEFVYEIIGSEGVIRYDRIRRTFERRDRQGTAPLKFGPEKGFESMYEAWARMLIDGTPDERLCDGQDAIRVTEIARDATEQAITGRLQAEVVTTDAAVMPPVELV